MLSNLGFGKTRKLPKYSVLVTCIGSTIGKMGMAISEMSSNQQINAVVVNSEHDHDFVYYAIQSRFPQYLPTIAVQAVPILSKSEFSKLSNNTTSLLEQKKIGRFLDLLDQRIAFQNKIIEDLKQLKSALSHIVFCKATQNVVRLGSIADIYQPQTIAQSDLTQSGYFAYGANGIIGYYTNFNHEQEQVCITCRGNTCGMVNFTKPFSWITGNAMVVNVDENTNVIDKKYLFYYLSQYNFKPLVSGSGQPQIVRTPIQKILIPLPPLQEQQLISNRLSGVQKKIEVENRVLDLLNSQKQYLLRQMFI